jgi:transglutaminase-like putative cysteine protease
MLRLRTVLVVLLIPAALASAAAARPATLPPSPVDRFADLAQAIRARPDDPRAVAWLWRLEALADEEPGDDPLPALLRDVAAAKRAPAALRDAGRWLSLRRALRAGEADAAAAQRAALGVPPHWALLGPFDNLGNRAFGADLGPEADAFAGIAEGRAYDGRGPDVRWRFLPDAAAPGGLPLLDLFEDAGDDELAAYAATGFTLTKAGRLDLRVGSADAVQVWVDGALVLRRDVRREAAPDQDVVPLTLAAGRHLVVAKVCRQRRPWHLVLRLTAPGGGPPPGVTFTSRADELLPAARPPQAGPAAPPAPLVAVRAALPPVGAETGADVPRLEGAARLERLFHPDDEADERALRLAERALALAPADGALHLALSRDLRDDDRRRAALEAAVRHAHAAGDAVTEAAALALLIERYDRRGESGKADEFLAALKAAAPEHPQLLLHRFRRLAAADAPDLALAGLAELVTARPRLLPALRAGMQLAREVRDPKRELAFAQARLRRDAQDRAARGRSLNLLGRDPRGSAADLLAAAVAADRYDLDLRLQHARALLREERLAEAAEAIRASAALYPGSYRLAELEGDLAVRRGDSAAAAAAFAESVRRKPQQRDLRRRAEYHGQAGPAVAADAADRERLREWAAAPVSEACRSVGACVLLSRVRVEVRPNGLASRTVEQVVRVTDRRLRDALREFGMPFVPDEHRLELEAALRQAADGTVGGPTDVRTVAPGGRQDGVYTNVQRRIVSFDDLAEGDVVLVRWRSDDVVVHNPFGDFFGDIRTFQSALPTLAAEYELSVPATRPLVTFEKGIPAPTVSEADGVRRYRWAARDLPPIVWEPRMPGYPEVGAYVNASTFEDWEQLHGWYTDLVREQRELDEVIRRTVREVTDGVEDPREKVRRLYGWVTANTRYVGIEFGIHGFKPYSVTQVFRRGYGDCKDKTFLLVAMLAEAGVEAWPVLLRTRDRGLLEPRPATLWAFNHVITYVPDLDLYLDPTNEAAGSEALHPLDQDALGLLVRDGGEHRIVRTPVLPADANTDLAEATLRLAPGGDATLTFRQTWTGHLATTARQLLHDASRREEELERLLASEFPGATVSALGTTGIEAPEEPVAVEVTAAIPVAARVADGRLRLPVVLFPSGLAGLVGQSERVHPLLLDYRRSERLRVRVEPPAGFLADRPPEGGVVESPFGRYELTVTRDGPAVVVDGALRLDVVRVTPEEFPAFRTFCLDVAALERRTLTFAPAAGASGAPRAALAAGPRPPATEEGQ